MEGACAPFKRTRETMLQFLRRQIGNAVGRRNLGIDLSDRWQRLNQRAADIERHGLDFCVTHNVLPASWPLPQVLIYRLTWGPAFSHSTLARGMPIYPRLHRSTWWLVCPLHDQRGFRY